MPSNFFCWSKNTKICIHSRCSDIGTVPTWSINRISISRSQGTRGVLSEQGCEVTMSFKPIFFKVKMETILHQVREINTCISIFTLMTSLMAMSALNIKLGDNCIQHSSTIKCTVSLIDKYWIFCSTAIDLDLSRVLTVMCTTCGERRF